MRWRVDQADERRFKADLAIHDLKVQGLMETLMHLFTSLDEPVKAELADRIRENGPQPAANWLSTYVSHGVAATNDGKETEPQ